MSILFIITVLIRMGLYAGAGIYSLRLRAYPCAAVAFYGCIVTSVSFYDLHWLGVVGTPLVLALCWVIVTAAERHQTIARMHDVLASDRSQE